MASHLCWFIALSLRLLGSLELFADLIGAHKSCIKREHFYYCRNWRGEVWLRKHDEEKWLIGVQEEEAFMERLDDDYANISIEMWGTIICGFILPLEAINNEKVTVSKEPIIASKWTLTQRISPSSQRRKPWTTTDHPPDDDPFAILFGALASSAKISAVKIPKVCGRAYSYFICADNNGKHCSRVGRKQKSIVASPHK